MANEEAYQIALNGLKRVWDAVSRSATSWAKNPKMNLGVATTNVQTDINKAVAQIKGLTGLEKPAKTIIDDIAIRLEAFKSNLTFGKETQPIVNAAELLDVWNRAAESMLNDIAARAPEVARLPIYIELSERIAA
jgi:hypothetical protein